MTVTPRSRKLKRVTPAAVPAIAPAETLRDRRKREGMRRVQGVAVDLFGERGFDAVSVDDVARAAGVGAATVYRWFGTKERLVLWDDYDPDLFQGIASRLPGASVVDAVEEAIIDGLADVYDVDKTRILRRARLMLQTPQLQMTAAADRQSFRRLLAALLLSSRSAKDALAADVVAGAIAAAVEAAIDHWVAARGKTPLARLFRLAFARLRLVS